MAGPISKFVDVVINTITSEVVPARQEAAIEVAEKAVEFVKDSIRGKQFGFTVAAETEARKKRDPSAKYGGLVPLVRSGQYVEAIEARVTDYGALIGVKDIPHYSEVSITKRKAHYKMVRTKKGPAYRRIPAKTTVKYGGRTVSMSQLAEWLEFGTSDGHVPPFPHFRPAMKRMRREYGRINKVVYNRITNAVKKAAQIEAKNLDKELVDKFKQMVRDRTSV